MLNDAIIPYNLSIFIIKMSYHTDMHREALIANKMCFVLGTRLGSIHGSIQEGHPQTLCAYFHLVAMLSNVVLYYGLAYIWPASLSVKMDEWSSCLIFFYDTKLQRLKNKPYSDTSWSAAVITDTNCQIMHVSLIPVPRQNQHWKKKPQLKQSKK